MKKNGSTFPDYKYKIYFIFIIILINKKNN